MQISQTNYLFMDARYRAQQEYLDKLKSWITVTGEGEGNDESDKHL